MAAEPGAIGVFDSGVGGLTVLRALRRRLPGADFIYLGDTARLPYGTKSAESVRRYALQAAGLLVDQGVGMLVVACNTVSAVALGDLEARFRGIPVVGVVRPGAEASCRASRAGRIAVLATEGTVRGGAYQREILALNPAARVTARACSLFVALAEEGWVEGDLVERIVRRYLAGLWDAAPDQQPDTLVLGCTHFPVLAGPISAVAGPGVAIVDSAETTAATVEARLREAGGAAGSGSGGLRLLATDGAERFARVGRVFLGEEIGAGEVEIADL